MARGEMSVRVFCLVVFFAALCLRVVAYATADADPAYLGTWQFTEAAARTAHERVSVPAARDRFIGRTVVFSAKAIAGPAPFACRAPHYALTGAAAGRTLQTGCAFDVRFVNASTAQVGLGDVVYTLTKR
jgi:hypothetical protein